MLGYNNNHSNNTSPEIKSRLIIKQRTSLQNRDKIMKKIQIKRPYNNQNYTKNLSYNYIKSINNSNFYNNQSSVSSNNITANKQIQYKKRAVSRFDNNGHYLTTLNYSNNNISTNQTGKKSSPNYNIKKVSTTTVGNTQSSIKKKYTINNDITRKMQKNKNEEIILNLFNRPRNIIQKNNVNNNPLKYNFNISENDKVRLNTVNDYGPSVLSKIEEINSRNANNVNDINLNEPSSTNSLFKNNTNNFNNSPLKDNDNVFNVNQNNISELNNTNNNSNNNNNLPNNNNINSNVNTNLYLNNNQFLTSQMNNNNFSKSYNITNPGVSMTSSIINLTNNKIINNIFKERSSTNSGNIKSKYRYITPNTQIRSPTRQNRNYNDLTGNKISNPSLNKNMTYCTTTPNNIITQTGTSYYQEKKKFNKELTLISNSYHKNIMNNPTNSKSKKYNMLKHTFEDLLKLLNETDFNRNKLLTNILEELFVGYHEVATSFNTENKKLKQINYTLAEKDELLNKKLLEAEKVIKEKNIIIEKLEEKISQCNGVIKKYENNKLNSLNDKQNQKEKEKLIIEQINNIDDNNIQNQRVQKLNEANLDDLDALYFYDKINIRSSSIDHVPNLPLNMMYEGEKINNRNIKKIRNKSNIQNKEVKNKVNNAFQKIRNAFYL